METSHPTLHILDVGHGNSAVLVDGDSVTVFDAGPRTTLLEFLDAEKITKVDTVLISHADKDHIEGLVSLIESGTVDIGRVRLNSDLNKKTELWHSLVYLLEQKDRAGKLDFDVSLTTKQTGQFDTANVTIEILAPSLGMAATGPGSIRKGMRMLSSNSISAVFRLSYQGRPRAILLGDITLDAYKLLLVTTPSPSASVMVYPHHGGASERDDPVAFAKLLCTTIKPSTVLFSIGRGKFDTPIEGIVKAIRSISPQTRLSCTQLSEHCASHLPSIVPIHLTAKFAAGKASGCCCAGTISISFNDDFTELHPIVNAHDEFINKHTANPLCK